MRPTGSGQLTYHEQSLLCIEVRQYGVPTTHQGDCVDGKDIHQVEHRGEMTPHILPVQLHLCMHQLIQSTVSCMQPPASVLGHCSFD